MQLRHRNSNKFNIPPKKEGYSKLYNSYQYCKAGEIGQGLLNRWTSQYDWGITAGGLTFNLNNGTKTPLIIVKILENTFLGMKKVRAWPILTLAMPYVKTEQIQNLALF